MPKKSNTPFTYYSFRYDYQTDDEIERIKSYIIREIPKYAIFIEISTEVGKKHIQGKLGKCLSEVQLRKHLKEEFPQFEKSNYSIAVIKDIEKYDSYICKDGKPLCNNVFTEEYILEQVNKHVNLVQDNIIRKDKIKASIPFTQKVFEEFVKKHSAHVAHIQTYSYLYNPTDYERDSYDKSCEFLLGFLLKHLGGVVKVFDDCVLQRMYTGLKNSILQMDESSANKQLKYYSSKINL